MSGGVYVGKDLVYLSNNEILELMKSPSMNPISRSEMAVELSSRLSWTNELPPFMCTKSMKKKRCEYVSAGRCINKKSCEYQKEA